jgi:predicted transcriptional regulator
MRDLVELSAKLVLEREGALKRSTSDLVVEIKKVYDTLKTMEVFEDDHTTKDVIPFVERRKHVHGIEATITPPALTAKQAFRKDEVKCMICGTGGMKVLKQHLTREHHITPQAYRERFGIKKGTPLVATGYHDMRRQVALATGLGRNKNAFVPPSAVQKSSSKSVSRRSAVSAAPQQTAAPKTTVLRKRSSSSIMHNN